MFRRIASVSMRGALASTLVAVSAFLSGCAEHAATHDQADYVLVYLVTGPHDAEVRGEQRNTVFAGHMSNINRLADARQLIVAGPFSKPQDASWRGIFVMDVPTVDEARPLVETDPGVSAGVFKAIYRPLRAETKLRTLTDIDRRQREAQPASSQAADPAANIRPYAMLTAPDWQRAVDALRAARVGDAPLWDRVLWWGRFGDAPRQPGKEAVFLLDSRDVADVRKALQGANLGDAAIDTWYSTNAHEQLPHSTAP